jgi:hypothetical protein
MSRTGDRWDWTLDIVGRLLNPDFGTVAPTTSDE